MRILLGAIVVFAFCTGTLLAQTPATDSLQQLLNNHQQNDTIKARLLNNLATEYKSVDPAKSFEFATRALRLSKQLSCKPIIPTAYRTMGSYFYQKGDYAKALQAFEASGNWAKNIGDTVTLAWANNGKGTIFHSQSNYPKALEYYLQAVNLFEQSGRNKEAASIMGNVGVLYKEMGELTQALNQFKRGLQLQQQRGDENEVARFLNNIGNVYSDQKKYNEAEQAYTRALLLSRKLSNKHLEALLLRNLVDVEYSKGVINKAFEFAHRSLKLYQQLDEQEGLADAGYRMALLQLQSNNADSAIYYGTRALQTADEIGFKRNIFDTYDVLAKAYAKKGLYQKAYDAQLQYVANKDSLAGEDQQNMVEGLKFQYELDKKQSQIELLTKERQFQTEKAHGQRVRQYALLAVLLLVGVIAIVLIRSNRRKLKDNAVLKQQKEEIQTTFNELQATQSQLVQREKMASLGELTAGIAHEIQNPLNFVNNFADISVELTEEVQQDIRDGKGEQAIETASDIIENLKKVSFHGKRADAIVKAMLQHSRRSSDEKEDTDINALTDEFLRLSYHGLRAKDKGFNVTMHTDFDPTLPKVHVVSQDVGRVLLNLFNNAFYSVNDKKKLHPDNYDPTVWVSTQIAATTKGAAIRISIKDNGTGIPKQLLEKIYQPFFTTKPTGQGTGLGLSLSYDIVKAHGGEITVETTEGEGAEFIITLPADGSVKK